MKLLTRKLFTVYKDSCGSAAEWYCWQIIVREKEVASDTMQNRGGELLSVCSKVFTMAVPYIGKFNILNYHIVFAVLNRMKHVLFVCRFFNSALSFIFCMCFYNTVSLLSKC